MPPREAIEISPEVGAQIRGRRDELGLTVEEAVARAGKTPRSAVWYRVERTGGRFSPRTLRGICVALEWEPSSIEALLRGEPPTLRPGIDPATPASHSGSDGWPPRLEAQFRAYEEIQSGIVQDVTRLIREVAELRRFVEEELKRQ